MNNNEFVKGWDGNWYHDLGILGATGCPEPFSHSKELIERESPDYDPTDYIDALDEPVSFTDEDLLDWDFN